MLLLLLRRDSDAAGHSLGDAATMVLWQRQYTTAAAGAATGVDLKSRCRCRCPCSAGVA